MKDWRWIVESLVLAVHDKQLSEHGGLDGVRDVGAIRSALAKPQHLHAHGEPDVADLAAAYACGLARNHGFVDGNKRTAWVTARVFLIDNGRRLFHDRIETVMLMNRVASGDVDEARLAGWFRERIKGED